jgi:hypothetical protein
MAISEYTYNVMGVRRSITSDTRPKGVWRRSHNNNILLFYNYYYYYIILYCRLQTHLSADDIIVYSI